MELKPGAAMYVPAGTEHRAATTETSLHLTIGIIRVTYRDVLQRALAAAAPMLDRPLPVAYLRSDPSLLKDQIAEAADALIRELRVLDLSAIVHNEQSRRSRRPHVPGHVASLVRRDAITLDDSVTWTAPPPFGSPTCQVSTSPADWSSPDD